LRSVTGLDGRLLELDQVKALALSNYGHFTTMRVEEEGVRGLSLHLERLGRDCRSLFNIDLDLDRVRHDLRRGLDGVATPVIARVTVFDPELDLSHAGADAEPQTLITTRPAPSLPQPPLRVRATRYARHSHSIKHVGLFETVRLRRAAQRSGFDDAIFTDLDSHISEGTTWNAAFFDGDRVIWPRSDHLPGVTTTLLQQVDENFTTDSVALPQLAHMRAAFATNAVCGVRAISAVDTTLFPAHHPVLDLLREGYARIRPEPV
jgi:branched-subunit amino acid aminotransferase/4-amino-4-deoxychorismate lyase